MLIAFIVLAFFVVVFLMVSIAVVVAWMGFLKTTTEETEAARRDLETGEGLGGLTAVDVLDDNSPLFLSDRLSTINFWHSLLARFDFIEIVKERIAQAQLDWSVGRLTTLMLLCGTVALAIMLRVVPVWAALAAGIAVAFAPYAYVLRMRNKRFQKFREAFPDVLDSLARALRAGYPLTAALEMISSETAQPVSGEIRKTSAEANLGTSLAQALDNLGHRIPLLEVNLFIAAVQLHARTGGKLSEVMGSLAENMRESVALQGEVRSMAAHGKLTGVILTILPIGIATMMMWVSPGYMMVLFNHPYGKDLIAAAIGCLVLAHFVIGRIVDIKV